MVVAESLLHPGRYEQAHFDVNGRFAVELTAMRNRKLVVAAHVRDKSGCVLLTQRKADQPMPNLWELPGGKVEPGESPEQALERELAEEIGVRMICARIEEVIFFAYDDFDLYLLVFRATIEGEPTTRDVQAIRWVPSRELAQVDTLPADKQLFEKWARGNE